MPLNEDDTAAALLPISSSNAAESTHRSCLLEIPGSLEGVRSKSEPISRAEHGMHGMPAIKPIRDCGWGSLVTPELDEQTGRVRSTPVSPILARAVAFIDLLPDSSDSNGTIAEEYLTDEELYHQIEAELQSARRCRRRLRLRDTHLPPSPIE